MTAAGTPAPNDPRGRRRIDWNRVKQMWEEANAECERVLHQRLGPYEALKSKAQAAGWAFVALEKHSH